MTVFISGGCKNGKSTLAERIARALAGGGPLYYVATMIPHDGEDIERIRRHVNARAGHGFVTIECGIHILDCIPSADVGGTFLVDSVTALLANEMFRPDEPVDLSAPGRVTRDLEKLSGTVKNAVFVSDFIHADAERYGELTEVYRHGLASIDLALARLCDTVAEVCAGCPVIYKGVLPG